MPKRFKSKTEGRALARWGDLEMGDGKGRELSSVEHCRGTIERIFSISINCLSRYEALETVPGSAHRRLRATVLPFTRELPNQRSTPARRMPRAYPRRQAGESSRFAASAARALRRDRQDSTCLEGVARRVGAPRRGPEAAERSTSIGASASDRYPPAPGAAQTSRSSCGRAERASGSCRASRAVASGSLVPRNRPAPGATARPTELRTRSANAAKQSNPSHRGKRGSACGARGRCSRRGGARSMSGVDSNVRSGTWPEV